MLTSILVIMFMAALMVAALYLSAVLLDRALARVVHRFRKHGALDVWNAKTKGELGFPSRDLAQRLTHPKRDYQSQALAILMQMEVVTPTGDGKLYLTERRLKEYCRHTDKRSRVCSVLQPAPVPRAERIGGEKGVARR